MKETFNMLKIEEIRALIDVTKNADEPKKCDLIELKKLCKN